MHVLLIEPDHLQATAIAQSLRRNGHSVAHSRSAQRAVQCADEKVPDVVVLELQLPQHNGVEFLYEFRSYFEWLHIPVVIHSFVPPRELKHAVTLHKELCVVNMLHKTQTSLQQLCDAVARTATQPARS